MKNSARRKATGFLKGSARCVLLKGIQYSAFSGFTLIWKWACLISEQSQLADAEGCPQDGKLSARRWQGYHVSAHEDGKDKKSDGAADAVE